MDRTTLLLWGAIGSILLLLLVLYYQRSDSPATGTFVAITGFCGLVLATIMVYSSSCSGCGDGGGIEQPPVVLLAANDVEEKLLRKLSTEMMPFDSKTSGSAGVVVARFDDAAHARAQVKAHLQRGSRIFVGVVFTSVIDALYDLFEANPDAVLISSGSTAPKYAKVDNIYRMVPPDNKSIEMVPSVLREANLDLPRNIFYDDESTWAVELAQLLSRKLGKSATPLSSVVSASACASCTASPPAEAGTVVVLAERWSESILRMVKRGIIHPKDKIVLGDVAFMADVPTSEQEAMRELDAQLFAIGAFGGFNTDVSAVANMIGTQNVSPILSLLVSGLWIAFDCTHIAPGKRNKYIQDVYGPDGARMMDAHGDNDFVQVGVVQCMGPAYSSWSVVTVEGLHPIYGRFQNKFKGNQSLLPPPEMV